MMQRRLFLQALAASVVAVGAPLPVGFPTEFRSNERIMVHGEDFTDAYARWQRKFLTEATKQTAFFT